MKATKVHSRTTHGLWKHPLYQTWNKMRHRCLSSKNKQYEHYGGRGIGINKEWDWFPNFVRDMGPKPSKDHSLDRIDNNKGYSKQNCRWATWYEQENNRRFNKKITFNGRTKNKSQWAREVGISLDLLCWRMKAGWPISRVLSNIKHERRNKNTV